jgi:glycosyltransferase A (GT-A) superfamily protein (DUF2064 family)
MPVDRRIVAFDGRPDFDTAGLEVRPQVGGPLDQRIAAALDDCAEPVLLIGMDTPHLQPEDVAPVFRSWQAGASRHEAWLGMATDGGYWGLALTDPSGACVRGVPMSRPDTGALQHARLRKSGRRVRALPQRTDIDDVAALREALAVAPPEGRLRQLFDLSRPGQALPAAPPAALRVPA